MLVFKQAPRKRNVQLVLRSNENAALTKYQDKFYHLASIIWREFPVIIIIKSFSLPALTLNAGSNSWIN